MSNAPLIMALDQGTTSSRAVIFDQNGQMLASAQQDFEQLFPQDGWVEHRPEDIWASTLQTARGAYAQAQKSGQGDVVSIGITNQRETVLIWERATGKPICNALVWQDRRTAKTCRTLADAGHEALVQTKTGLLLDPYFSATKIAWILDSIPGAREAANRGELAFGTVDTFLIWRLTGGAKHLTDETNASRTCLYNIHTGDWDSELLALFDVPGVILPDVLPSASDFGDTVPELFGASIPIRAVAGDQQSAAFGQGCVSPGMTKSTYGTGCFMLTNTGERAVPSSHRLLTTRACRTGSEPQFAIEGSIFIAGAVAQWLRDAMGLVKTSPDTEAIAAAQAGNEGVYLVPAFTGLGAPHWNSEARGTLVGLTRDSGRNTLIRAALEAVAYQTEDLFEALRADGMAPETIRVDGGMAANSWLMQFISDITGIPLERPQVLETTALGAALLAGLQTGVWQSPDDAVGLAGPYEPFRPMINASERSVRLNGWKNAVKTALYHASLQATQAVNR